MMVLMVKTAASSNCSGCQRSTLKICEIIIPMASKKISVFPVIHLIHEKHLNSTHLYCKQTIRDWHAAAAQTAHCPVFGWVNPLAAAIAPIVCGDKTAFTALAAFRAAATMCSTPAEIEAAGPSTVAKVAGFVCSPEEGPNEGVARTDAGVVDCLWWESKRCCCWVVVEGAVGTTLEAVRDKIVADGGRAAAAAA